MAYKPRKLYVFICAGLIVLSVLITFVPGDQTQTISVTVTPVNDAPTSITLTSNSVKEDMAIGGIVGMLSTVDADVPSDSFTYTLMSNPNSLFAISGNSLRVANTLDFETLPTETIMIRTDDGNGGILDRIFTINITDEDEPVFVSIINENVIILNDPAEQSNFVDDQKNSAPILKAYLSTVMANDKAPLKTLGERSIRSREVLGLQEAESRSSFVEVKEGHIIKHGVKLLDNIFEGQLQRSDIGEFANENNDDQDISSLKDAMEFFTQIQTIQDYIAEETSASSDENADESEGETKGETSIIKRISIEDQFDDVLLYHLKNQQEFKDALRNVSEN
jgi:hypothetical protein